MDKIVFFWNGFVPIFRILIVGTLSFAAIVILLRSTGKRTLASMNAFDFVITITLGSVFGRTLTAQNVALSEVVTVFILLISLQYLIAYLQMHSKKFSKLVTAQPSLLFYQGRFLDRNIKKARLRKDEVLSAARKKGFPGLDEVEAIIMESDSSFSIIRKPEEEQETSNLTDIIAKNYT